MNYTYYITPGGVLAVRHSRVVVMAAHFVAKEPPEAIVHSMDSIAGLALDAHGTSFEKKVWHAVCRVPPGSTVSYQELAQKIGAPKAYRGVANALAHNPIAYLIPCHRVIKKDGSLGGYAWGTAIKKALLDHEKRIMLMI